MRINFNAKGFQICDSDSVLGKLLVTVQSKTWMAPRRTISHLLSSIHLHLNKFSFEISDSSYSFGVRVTILVSRPAGKSGPSERSHAVL